MKIEHTALLERNQGLAGTERKEEQETCAGVQEAFTVERSARESGIFGEAVYQKPQKDLADVMADASNQTQVKDAVTKKEEMLFASNTTSREDAKKLEEEGYSLTDTKIPTVVTETDKIKMQLAKAGVDISIFGDDLSEDQLRELAGNEALARQMAEILAKADLPATQENLTEAEEGMELAKELTVPSEGAVKYMLDNGLEPTIENLYKAEYSGSGSYQSPDSHTDYTEMTRQIETVIWEAGLTVSEETMSDSKWLLDNGVPLTPENLSYMRQLKELKLPAEEAVVMEAMAKAISEGKRPGEGLLMEGYSLADQAQAAAEVLEGADDESLSWLIDHELELTIENLRKAGAARSGTEHDEAGTAESVPAGEDRRETSQTAAAEKELALLTARRQLEEARLSLTAQANYSLLKQGISLDTKPLVQLVDALKEQENGYYRQLLEQDKIPATEENTTVYKRTAETIEAFKETPAYTLGVPELDEAGLKELYEAGKSMQEEFRKAGESYETMMTEPRRDLGDTIQKAFANVDDILEDLGLEPTESNERAVRILAYNSQEITEDAILQVKAKDEAVQRCFRDMTPTVVREMIREGVNPLDLTMEELDQKALEIKADLGVEEEERFSKYLWKMDQNHAMTEEERSAFLGIYRLITQVEKTDGAAIGALMEQGSSFTMRNLLTQVRSEKHGGREYSVDDEFGGISASGGGLSITEQIEKGYQTSCMRDILDQLTPEKLGALMEQADWQELTPEQLAERLEQMSGPDTPEGQKDEQLNQQYLQEKISDLSQAAKASEEVYQLLLDCDLPVTAQNVIAAQELAANKSEAFRRFFEKGFGQETDPDQELAEIKADILEQFGEAVKSPKELAEAQKALADTAENVMKTMINEKESVSSIDLREMKLLHTQIAIGTARLKEEKYAIPVLVGDEITSVSLKIVRGKEKKGMVDILFSTEALGQVSARLIAGKEGTTGYVTAERKETTQLLAENDAAFSESLGEKAQIRYLTAEGGLASVNKEETGNIPNEESEDYQVQTRTLYHMAESFIRLVKGME